MDYLKNNFNKVCLFGWAEHASTYFQLDFDFFKMDNSTNTRLKLTALKIY